MLRRSIGTAIAAVTATVAVAVLFAYGSASARSGGAGGGHPGAFGFSGPHVPHFGVRGTFRSSGARFLNRHAVRDRAPAARHGFFRLPFELALPYGGLLYGSYDDMSGLTVPYGPYGAGMDVNSSVDLAVLQAAIYRPACRLQTQTRGVPLWDGGTREITITRCVHPAVPPLARPSGWDSGLYAAAGNRTDDAAFDITSPTTVAARPREPDSVSAGGCRIEARSVPAEGGGDRKITITRC